MAKLFKKSAIWVLILGFVLGSFSATAAPNETIIRPNAAGDETNLVAVGATDNWECVNEEISDDDTTYVRSDGTGWGLSDLYNLPDPNLSGTINSVTIYAKCRSVGTPVQTALKIRIKTNNAVYEGSEETLTTSYADYSTTYTNNPQSGSGWTWTEINALQAGISLRDSITTAAPSGRRSYCTQVWVTIDYTPPGELTISSPTSATLTGKTVSIDPQTSTGVIGDNDHTNTIGVKVADDRAGSPGWTATLTSTHFTTRATTKLLSGSNNTVDFTGTYDGLHGVKDPTGTFKVEITTGGAVGTAVFKWWDPSGTLTSDVTTDTSVSLSNGISVTFAAATYVVGNSWSAGVDVFPYTGLTVTPSDIYAESGSLTGVSKGSSEALTGTGATSNAKTLMTATAGNGTGIYWQDEDLSLSIHANSLSGDFTATATLTVS